MGPINSIYEEFESNQNNLMVLAVCSDGTDATVKAKHDDAGIDFPIISGTSGGSSIFGSYKISATPTLILIKPDKSIPEKDIWPISTLEGTMAKYDILDGSSVSDVLLSDVANFSLKHSSGTLSVDGLSTGEYDMSLCTIQGRAVVQQSISASENSVNIKDISKGIYIVSLKGVDLQKSFLFEVK